VKRQERLDVLLGRMQVAAKQAGTGYNAETGCYVSGTGDKEGAHCDADDILCEAVSLLGPTGKAITELFEKMEKWYA
jgi:hypothetical protein